MKKADLEKFKSLLLHTKQQILGSGILKSTEDLRVSSDDLPDEADLASSVITQQVSFNIREREIAKLRWIEEALYRIENGSYGVCEECDEVIPAKRLEKQPWTTLCVDHAEERERESNLYRQIG